MHQIFDITSNTDGEHRHEKLMITYPVGLDLNDVFHNLGLELAMTPDGVKKYGNTGLSLNEFLSRVTPEELEPYNVTITWPDREDCCSGDKMLISRYELQSHLNARKRENNRVLKAREVSMRYIRKLGRLKANGHQLVSTWDNGRVVERANSWAYQFVCSNGWNYDRFFDERLDEAVNRAAKSHLNTDKNDEQNIPQSADGTDEQNVAQAE